MKKLPKKMILALLICVMALSPGVSAGAYSPPVSTVKVGLYYNTTALEGANLQNVSGYGSGYELGYFNDNRDFISLGAVLNTEKISIVIDKNMSYKDGNYFAGLDGANPVGCFHIQMNTAYSTYGEARAAADQYAASFVKYLSGAFYVMLGSYTSSADASAAVSALGLSGCVVNSGTTHTTAIVETPTGKILFEFDGGGTHSLGVMPRSVSGEKCQTWFKGYKYYGGFQYTRANGGALAVVNYVDVEDYCKGVIPYEMSPSWPIEALKVGATCARTYVMSHINAHKAHGFDVCTLEHCQVYRGTNSANANSDAAVDQTAGRYITYNGALCETYYSSSNGGASESSENVWLNARPYLKGVIDPYEADIAGTVPSYNWTVSYTRAALTSRLQGRGYNCATIVSVAITKYTDTGNVYTVSLTDANGKVINVSKGDTIRAVLGVRSMRFGLVGASETGGGGEIHINGSGTVSDVGGLYAVGGDGSVGALPPSGSVYAINGSGQVELVEGGGGATGSVASGDTFVFKGTGHGHSVGLSQWGAYSMAKFHNKTFEDIIHFYFTGVTIE